MENLRFSTKAVDIVPDSAGANDAALIRICRRDAADGEAIAPMDVGHGEAGALDAGEKRDVSDLVWRLIAANLLHQRFAGEDHAIDAHALLVAFRDAPAASIYLLQRASECVLT